MTNEVTSAALEIAAALKGKDVVTIAKAIDLASYQGGVTATATLINSLETLAHDALRAMAPPDFTEEQAKLIRATLLMVADKFTKAVNADLASNGFPPLEREGTVQ